MGLPGILSSMACGLWDICVDFLERKVIYTCESSGTQRQ